MPYSGGSRVMKQIKQGAKGAKAKPTTKAKPAKKK